MKIQENRLKYIKKETIKNEKKIKYEIEKTSKIENIKKQAAKWNQRLKEHEKLVKMQEDKNKKDIQQIHNKQKSKIGLKKQKILEAKKLKAEKIRREKMKLKEKSVNLKQKELEEKRNNYLKK